GLEQIKSLKKQDADLDSEVQKLMQLRNDKRQHFENIRKRYRPFVPFACAAGGLMVLFGFLLWNQSNYSHMLHFYVALAGIVLFFVGAHFWQVGSEEIEK